MNKHYMFCTLPPISDDIQNIIDDDYDYTGDIERIAKIAEITERG